MTVDHVYIYWYQASSNRLFILDKMSGTMSTSRLQGVTDILAFGPHLQPLPGMRTLRLSQCFICFKTMLAIFERKAMKMLNRF